MWIIRQYVNWKKLNTIRRRRMYDLTTFLFSCVNLYFLYILRVTVYLYRNMFHPHIYICSIYDLILFSCFDAFISHHILSIIWIYSKNWITKWKMEFRFSKNVFYLLVFEKSQLVFQYQLDDDDIFISKYFLFIVATRKKDKNTFKCIHISFCIFFFIFIS